VLPIRAEGNVVDIQGMPDPEQLLPGGRVPGRDDRATVVARTCRIAARGDRSSRTHFQCMNAGDRRRCDRPKLLSRVDVPERQVTVTAGRHEASARQELGKRAFSSDVSRRKVRPLGVAVRIDVPDLDGREIGGPSHHPGTVGREGDAPDPAAHLGGRQRVQLLKVPADVRHLPHLHLASARGQKIGIPAPGDTRNDSSVVDGEPEAPRCRVPNSREVGAAARRGDVSAIRTPCHLLALPKPQFKYQPASVEIEYAGVSGCDDRDVLPVGAERGISPGRRHGVAPDHSVPRKIENPYRRNPVWRRWRRFREPVGLCGPRRRDDGAVGAE
jgi:hypothetical protein